MNTPLYKLRKLCGYTGKLSNKIINNFLMGLNESNPSILYMFRDRDVKPYRLMLPWSGEFAGKYITGMAYMYKLTSNQELYDYAVDFIGKLLKYQDSDGYLGCFDKEHRMAGVCVGNVDVDLGEHRNWDAWAHYHIMYGLLLWYDITLNDEYMNAIKKMAEFLMNTFYKGSARVIDMGSSGTNLSLYHIFGILFRRTGDSRYMKFAKEIETDLSSDRAGDYINSALLGYEFYQSREPRWEGLHTIMGILEMYKNTNETRYLDAANKIFYSILKTDVHNTGAFSTEEHAIGNPYENGNIETCCVIAYNALAIELYEVTGDIRIIDFLERSHYNAILGYNSPSGRWATYNTPMEGEKCASAHSINFQCRPGSPELNCCSVNAPRGVANVETWMFAENKDTLYVNFYEDCEAVLNGGTKINIKGGFPVNNQITLNVEPKEKGIKLALRIPSYSQNTEIIIEDKVIKPLAGTYYSINLNKAAEIKINFDFAYSFEAGGGAYEGKCSIFRGPVLLGLGLGDNHNIDFEELPKISKLELNEAEMISNNIGEMEVKLKNGIILKDFCHLGFDGSKYKTYFEIE